jgi:hypothetical protein
MFRIAGERRKYEKVGDGEVRRDTFVDLVLMTAGDRDLVKDRRLLGRLRLCRVTESPEPELHP